MRRQIRTTVIVAATTGTLALGCGISAWAAWPASAVPAVGRATVAQVPPVSKPQAVLKVGTGFPVVTWPSPVQAPDRPFDGFVVIRRNGSLTTTVCTVAATTRTCNDETAPGGAIVTYTVRATAAPSWVGPDSEPSAALQVPPSTAPGTKQPPAPTPLPTLTAPAPPSAPALPGPTLTPTPSPTPTSSPTQAVPPQGDIDEDPVDTQDPPPPASSPTQQPVPPVMGP